VTAQLESTLAAATLSSAERRTVGRFVDALRRELGDDLVAVWLYGSRARGERPHPDSDVDLLVIAEGGHERHARRAMDLSEEAAYAEDQSPFAFSVHVHDTKWLRRRREVESFFIAEVDRDKLVLAGSDLQ
jgi:predicted nucleotidyltransferase